MTRIFGEINGVKVGDIFESRKALHDAKIHDPIQPGINGSEIDGANSIVLSGGYADDEDYGDEIIYTGMGGRLGKTTRVVEDQELRRGNKALAISFEEGLPIRVVRGAKHKSPFSPSTGYRYDGLYKITNYWQETGKDGYKIWRFKLERFDSTPLDITMKLDDKESIPTRVTATVNRLVRDNIKAFNIKKMYDNKCQICGIRIETPLGSYSEAAHIKPLGKPHNGTDNESNMLCLCPNHHKMLDYHVFTINDDLSLVGIKGKITLNKNHNINKECLKYHREHFYYNSSL